MFSCCFFINTEIEERYWKENSYIKYGLKNTVVMKSDWTNILFAFRTVIEQGVLFYGEGTSVYQDEFVILQVCICSCIFLLPYAPLASVNLSLSFIPLALRCQKLVDQFQWEYYVYMCVLCVILCVYYVYSHFNSLKLFYKYILQLIWKVSVTISQTVATYFCWCACHCHKVYHQYWCQLWHPHHNWYYLKCLTCLYEI